MHAEKCGGDDHGFKSGIVVQCAWNPPSIMQCLLSEKAAQTSMRKSLSQFLDSSFLSPTTQELIWEAVRILMSVSPLVYRE